LKPWPWRKGEGNAGVTLIKFGGGDPAGTGGRVVEVNPARISAFDHQKVVEMPEHNKRRLQLQHSLQAFLEALGLHGVATGSLEQAGGGHPIPRHAAGLAQLGQGDNFAVVAQHLT
jgi:hypothetical protein